MTLVEVVISLALMSLLSIITVAGMIMHARMAQSNIEKQKIAESSRRFIDLVQVTALDATLIEVETGPSGAGTVLTLGQLDPDTNAMVYRQFAYLDRDKNPLTIEDNVIVERNVDTPSATTGQELVQYCSLVGNLPVFSQNAAGARPFYDINLRVGDRGTTAAAGRIADNALTGRGYQSFLISTSVSRL